MHLVTLALLDFDGLPLLFYTDIIPKNSTIPTENNFNVESFVQLAGDILYFALKKGGSSPPYIPPALCCKSFAALHAPG